MADTATAATDPSRYKNQSLIDELNAALATGGGDERKRILERVADLFAAGSRGYSSQQIGLFDDVLQKLCSDIEVKTRARLARRLADIDNAPPQLIRSLAFDDAIAVAQPVLIHSQQLSDADLVENATTKSQDHLFAIAQRLRLSERVDRRSGRTRQSQGDPQSRRQYGRALFAGRLRQAEPPRPTRPQADARTCTPTRPAPPVFPQAS